MNFLNKKYNITFLDYNIPILFGKFGTINIFY